MAGAKFQKAKGSSIGGKIKYLLSGGPGKAAGGKLATGLINMHKKKRK